MPRHPRPKVLSDIQRGRESVFGPSSLWVNLSYRAVWRVPLSRGMKLFVMLSAAWILIAGLASAPTPPTLAAPSVTDEEERRALESQLQELEKQIDEYEGQIVGYQKQGKTLKGEIDRLNKNIAKLNLQIQAINLTLTQLDTKIADTQFQISATEASIDRNKLALGSLIRSIYEAEQASLIEIFLKNPKLSDFFSNINSLTLLQGNLRATTQRITDLRDELQDQKEQFALARADAATLHSYQEAQRSETDAVKKQKNELLTITKGQESRYQTLLKETKASASEIRKRIFKLLGGGELSFEEAYQYAKLAGAATGIRPALILAVLDRESALGRNVGRCSYRTAMSPSNQTIFLRIVSELNISPESITVSCPNADGTYGGAMGPAQFIPSTWTLYRDAVARVTGSNPPSPWSNADAFVATALYLRDAMGSCTVIYSSGVTQERCAAARYYAGGRWRSYLWTYGEAVVSRAKSFQEDIDTITS